MDNRYVKIFASGSKAPLKATPGHFATNHAHINYYLDMTTLKTRLSEAQEVAKHLAERFLFDKVVDTIVCLEGTQVIGAYLAEELTRAGVPARGLPGPCPREPVDKNGLPPHRSHFRKEGSLSLKNHGDGSCKSLKSDLLNGKGGSLLKGSPGAWMGNLSWKISCIH